MWRGERERSGPDGLARELALCRSRETAEGRTAAWFVEDRTESFPSGKLYRRGRYRRRGSARTRSAERALRDPGEQAAGDGYSQRRDRTRIMPLGTNAASRAAGTLAATRVLVVQDGRRGLRGKKDSVRPRGSHRPQYTRWRDDGSLASRGLHSDPGRVPVSVLDS